MAGQGLACHPNHGGIHMIKTNPKYLFIFTVSLLCLLLTGGSFSLLPGQSSVYAQERNHEKFTYRMDPFIVNLATLTGQRQLVLNLDIQLEGRYDSAYIERQNPKVRDRLIDLLSSKRYEEIGSISGKHELQKQIHHLIHTILGNELLSVSKVTFTNFVVN